jgi:hypothetical protein
MNDYKQARRDMRMDNLCDINDFPASQNKVPVALYFTQSLFAMRRHWIRWAKLLFDMRFREFVMFEHT